MYIHFANVTTYFIFIVHTVGYLYYMIAGMELIWGLLMSYTTYYYLHDCTYHDRVLLRMRKVARRGFPLPCADSAFFLGFDRKIEQETFGVSTLYPPSW